MKRLTSLRRARLPLLPMRDYDPAWESRMAVAESELKRLYASPWDDTAALDKAHRERSDASRAEFQFSDGFRDWWMDHFYGRVGRRWDNVTIPEMLSGLTVRDIKRRFRRAERLIVEIGNGTGIPTPRQAEKLMSVIGRPPLFSECISAWLAALRGGDRFRASSDWAWRLGRHLRLARGRMRDRIYLAQLRRRKHA